MINLNLKDINDLEGNELDVVLYSNNWEFEMGIGDGHFGKTLNLDKDQVQELIDTLTKIHEEMI